MLISTLRLYERCLLGFESKDQEVQDAAQSCLSFLVIHLKRTHVALPSELEGLAKRLPEAEHHPA